jgi:hypothetical protein
MLKKTELKITGRLIHETLDLGTVKCDRIFAGLGEEEEVEVEVEVEEEVEEEE